MCEFLATFEGYPRSDVSKCHGPIPSGFQGRASKVDYVRSLREIVGHNYFIGSGSICAFLV